MNPFILLPVGIVNSNKEEQTVEARIQPDQIDYYYPGFFEGSVIVNKSGNSFFTKLPVENIDAILIQYEKEKKSKVGKFGIMKISK